MFPVQGESRNRDCTRATRTLLRASTSHRSRRPTGHQQALINLICMILSEVDNFLQAAFFEGEKTGNGELDSNTKRRSTIAVI